MTLDSFHQIVKQTIDKLEEVARNDPNVITSLNSGELFQNYVYRTVQEITNAFEPSATVTNKPSKAFPDIIIQGSDGNKYGIEVKSSSENKAGWEIPGNSVNESTLEADLIEIQLIFGKTHRNILQFKAGLYSDKVKTIRSTHYPRYIIDMDISPRETIFHDMGKTFEEINALSENERLQAIKDHFIKNGQYYWWLSSDAGSAIALFEGLDRDTIDEALAFGFVHYPELLSNSRTKYVRLAKYIASEYGAVSTSLRDRVSAGGKQTFDIGANHYSDVPKVYHTMYNCQDKIRSQLNSCRINDLKSDWGYDPECGRKKAAWVNAMNHAASDDLAEQTRIHLLKDIIGI